MPFSIKVSNLGNGTSWEKILKEDRHVISYVKGYEAVGLVRATLMPVRTNNFKNFAKDFFLPTIVNHAIKVQHSVGRIFAILGALILDSLTFPIRLLTCIPAVILNAWQAKNPLKKYLVNVGVNPKLLKDDHVRERMQWEKLSATGYTTTPDGVRHPCYQYITHWSEQNINFIKVPTYPGYGYYESGRER